MGFWWTEMERELVFSIKSIAFDEHYQPSGTTRLTTNFANLARGTRRRENLRNTLSMIDNRFNSLVQANNPNGDRYGVALDIVSADIELVPGARPSRPSRC